MLLRRILWAVVIVCGLAWAGVVGARRIQVERAYNTVELIVDLDDARVLSAGSQVPIGKVLERFRNAGATAVALRELTLERLIDNGEVSIQNGWVTPVELSGLGSSEASRRLAKRLADRLSIPGLRAADGVLPGRLGETEVGAVIGAGLGLSDKDVGLADQAHLIPVARYSNAPPLDANAICRLCGDAQRAGARMMIFDGDQVLGYPGLIWETVRCLRAMGMAYGSVEFAKQRGDAALGKALNGRIVRVHSITEQEMPNIKREEAVERFVRAVRERNIRACYLRLFTAPEPDAVAFNVEYVGELKTALEVAGYRIGAAQPFPEVRAAGHLPMRWRLLPLGVIVLLGALVLALSIRRPPWSVYWTAPAVVVVILALLCVVGAPGFVQWTLPLRIAVLFPTLGLVAVHRWLRPSENAPASTGRAIGRALMALAIASAISWLGGLLLASVLTETLYMTAVRRFVGVKLALVAPILFVALIYLADAFAREDWSEQKRHMADRLRAFFGAEWRVWHTLVAIAALGAIAVALMRSGNEPGVGVAGLEMKLRGLLESTLYARPRFKEFAIGHPALMLAAALAAQGRPRWVLPLLLVGVIGQVSLINTYEHLHTPLLLSLLRTANGLWIGAVIGIIAILIFARRKG